MSEFNRRISIDPWSATHDMGVMVTSVDAVTEHMALAVSTLLFDVPRGRLTGSQRDAWAAAMQRIQLMVRPAAEQLVSELDVQVNAWFAVLLASYGALRGLSTARALRALEETSPETAVWLLGMPGMRTALARLRQDDSDESRRRLRRAFAKFAVAPAARGRKKKGRTAVTPRIRGLCDSVRNDVKAYRQQWKGDLTSAEARTEAFALAHRYLAGVPNATIAMEARKITESRVPVRAVENLIQAATNYKLGLPTIRSILRSLPQQHPERTR